ncbi:hypothetical protein Q1695_014910 [Nippostrongylus brasiliensis]|nr:hypothetical protein Q1695_014910 [Nippostrongylus brasiliensis]
MTSSREYVRKTMPMIGLGTYQIRNENYLRNVVDAALSCGCRLFDTAQLYGNEAALGRNLIEFLPKYNLTRSDIFIITKIAPENQGTEAARSSVKQSLSNLQLDYIDLMLIHWPGTNIVPTADARSAELRKQTYTVLEEFHGLGVIRAIGVSNYEIRHLEMLLAHCKVPPALNQIELHPHFHQLDLLEYCKARDIAIQAYSSLGGLRYHNRLFADEDVKELAAKYAITVPQFLLSWGMSQSICVLPCSTSRQRTIENFSATHVRIDNEDVQRLLNNGKRYKVNWDPVIID